MPPPNSFPLTPSCRGHGVVVLPHLSLRMVFLRNAICGVSRPSGTLSIPAWRARGSFTEAVSSLLIVAVKICYASSMVMEDSKEYLTRKFLTAAAINGWRRLLGLSQPERR
jgi:hypothetical protein